MSYLQIVGGLSRSINVGIKKPKHFYTRNKVSSILVVGFSVPIKIEEAKVLSSGLCLLYNKLLEVSQEIELY